MPSDGGAQTYSGSVELWTGDGQLLALVHVSIPDLDAPVWSARSAEPIDVRDVDPEGETVIARLADRAHPRVGEAAAAHLQLRDQLFVLAGNYGFHATRTA
jgi:hypothetical protein